MSESLVAALRQSFGLRRAVLTGRGRTGLAALVDVLAAGQPYNIIMPSTICPSLYAAVWGEGRTIRLVPPDPATGLPDDAAMAAAVAGTQGPGLVMPTHLYGLRGHYPQTYALAKRRGWFVLINDVSCVTTQVPEIAVEGDAILLSFGAGKILDAGGGGALLTNDDELADRLMALVSRYPVLDEAAERVEDWFLRMRRELRTAPPPLGPQPGLVAAFLPLDARFQRHAFPAALSAPVQAALARLPEEALLRRRRHAHWIEALAGLPGITFLSAEAALPWRFLCRITPEYRDFVVDAVRAAGFDAGVNYPPLTDFYPTLLGDQETAADRLWRDSVINFWTTSRYDDSTIRAVAGIVEKALAL